MPGLLDRIMSKVSPPRAERAAEEENIERAPEGVRGRMRDILSRGRRTREEEERVRKQKENQERHHREGTKASDLG